jgi:hypothetical protein
MSDIIYLTVERNKIGFFLLLLLGKNIVDFLMMGLWGNLWRFGEGLSR